MVIKILWNKINNMQYYRQNLGLRELLFGHCHDNKRSDNESDAPRGLAILNKSKLP